MEQCFVWIRNTDTKKMREEITKKLNVMLKKNCINKLAGFGIEIINENISILTTVLN